MESGHDYSLYLLSPKVRGGVLMIALVLSLGRELYDSIVEVVYIIF